MTHVTFGVSTSSFVANMPLKQNAFEFATTYPLAAKAVYESFYVNDGLIGADTLKEALELQSQFKSYLLVWVTFLGNGFAVMRKCWKACL